ncbi:hypothetical protein [Azospirillum thermophilum]|uniref:Phasin domain-containing protein n=1 Tax=Azospirillum thermophilum TaxID=2202148 RepID=A0A2S2CZV8_9PROT|nr:hypothetical protein [Azospirillum thermophilum]AWK89975.1 hypothetical protein DEW08_28650 [Azospirillum thermophilum]
MTSQPSTPTPIPTIADLAKVWTPWQTVLSDQTRLWLRGQAQALAALERFNEDWLRRRRAGVNAALAALDRMNATDDAAERNAIANAWATEAAGRWVEDMKSMADCMEAVTKETMASGGEAAERSASAAGGLRAAARATAAAARTSG